MIGKPLHLIKGIAGRTFYRIPQQPERIQIEITNRCNYSCGMCPREYFHLPENDISFDLFTRIIHRLTQKKFYQYAITLTGWGEPLLHPQLADMIVYVKDMGHVAGITTNGLLLASFVERFIGVKLDKLTVSLDNVGESTGVPDGHPSYKIIQKSVRTLIQLRGDKRKPFITIQTTMHNKQQCLEAVRFAGEVGADRIYLVRLNISLGKNGFKRPGLEEELEIYKEAEKIARKYGLQVDTNYVTFRNNLLRTLYQQLRPALYKFDKYCPKPYDYLYITVDGMATPCCDLPRYEVGNILDLIQA